MSTISVGLIGVVILFLLLLSRMTVGPAMALVGVLGFGYLVKMDAGFSILGRLPFTIASDYGMTVVPLFVLMGAFAFRSGLSERLYNTADKLVGHISGGLAMASVSACSIFASVSGSASATAATMGSVALPEMKKYNYDPKLATGSLAAGGTIGVLIPPSASFILYGIITEQSIGKLFLAGIIPGILMTLLFILSIYVRVRLTPSLAPQPSPRPPIKTMVASLGGVVEAALLFGLVMGMLFTGLCSPTEAGAVGAFGSLLIGLVRRKLNRQAILGALKDTANITAMIFLVIIGAMVFSRFVAVTQIPAALATFSATLPLSPKLIMVFICFIFLLGGFFLDSPALILLFTPIFYPVVQTLGFDPIWFGVVVTISSEMGLISPPVGTVVFIIASLDRSVPIEDIFKGSAPFIVLMMLFLGVLILYPDIALFLPGFM